MLKGRKNFIDVHTDVAVILKWMSLKVFDSAV
jgi:hypothetical protein